MKVFIPLHKKDVNTLPYCIKSIKKFLKPYPDEVFVIGEGSLENNNKIKSLNVNFIDQDEILDGLRLRDVPKIVANNENRSGWYFQQFLKLGISFNIEDKYYTVFDADNVLVDEIKLIDDGKYIFHTTKQQHKPYFDTYNRLFDSDIDISKMPSFISDFMIFDTVAVRDMCKKIENQTNKKWYRIILEKIDKNILSSFSEFETYGNFFTERYKDFYKIIPYKNMIFSYRYIHIHVFLMLAAKIKRASAITYHNYKR